MPGTANCVSLYLTHRIPASEILQDRQSTVHLPLAHREKYPDWQWQGDDAESSAADEIGWIAQGV